jgi:uncharacterized protein YecE (DUF72 family)
MGAPETVYNEAVTDRIVVGCCGFPEARGRYFGRFSAVELQDTFYQPPSLALAEKRRRESPPGFLYTLKAWQLITHPATSPTYRRLREPVDEASRGRYGFFRPTEEVLAAWERTLAIARTLAAAVVVFQCPARFTQTEEHVADMEAFFGRIDRGGLTLAWEPRGKWHPALVRALCERLGLVHCVDPFENLCQHGEVAYFRLHGIGGYRYRYSDEELVRLRQMCGEELAAGRTAVYVMFNNVSMRDDALRFRALLD